jgi:phosphoribosylformylglycinamidine synthase
MIVFFQKNKKVYVLETQQAFNAEEKLKLKWLFSGAEHLKQNEIEGVYIGPRREMITPWSTNAVEITQNMGLKSIRRIEELTRVFSPYHDVDNVAYAQTIYDSMLQHIYINPNQLVFTLDIMPEPVKYIVNFTQLFKEEGLGGWGKEEEIV